LECGINLTEKMLDVCPVETVVFKVNGEAVESGR
jgi:hypothetical protein